jgi:opacity protein-like surface antigen
MRKNLILAVCTLIVLSSGLVAQAQEAPNLYLSGKLGLNLTNDADFKESGLSGEFQLDPAAIISGTFGVRITPNMRTELELSYREPDIDKVEIDGFGTFKADAELQTVGVLLNGYYDFLPEKMFSPFLTVGVGVLHHRIKFKSNTNFSSGKDSDVVFGFQAGGGVGWNVSRRVSIDVSYRYLGSTDPNFDGTKTEYGAHELLAGVRFNFSSFGK